MGSAQRDVRGAGPILEEISLSARTQAAEEWRRRVIAEYRAASVTHSLERAAQMEEAEHVENVRSTPERALIRCSALRSTVARSHRPRPGTERPFRHRLERAQRRGRLGPGRDSMRACRAAAATNRRGYRHRGRRIRVRRLAPTRVACR